MIAPYPIRRSWRRDLLVVVLVAIAEFAAAGFAADLALRFGGAS